MASINQLISEIAHSVKQADSIPVRRAIKLGIIHARNELIRHSYANHNYTDKVLQQRFKISLVDVPDGDIYQTKDLPLPKIKRTKVKVPRPVRLTNNLPFHSVRTAGVKNPIIIPFVKESVSINCINDSEFNNLGSIIIESVFEYPHIIEVETNDKPFDIDSISDDDEFLLPEDMITSIKKLILETWNANVIRDTAEIPSVNLA